MVGRLIFAGVLLLLPACAQTAEDRSRDFAKDGLHLYRQGSYAGARENFRAALVVKPEDADKAIARAEERAQEYAVKLRQARAEIFKMREQRIKQWTAERDAAVDVARKAADCSTVPGCDGVEVICCAQAAGPRHVLYDDGRIAWNMPAEMARHQPREQVVAAADPIADDQGDGPALVEIRDRVGVRMRRDREAGEERRRASR